MRHALITQWGADPIWDTEAVPLIPAADPFSFPDAVAFERGLSLDQTVQLAENAPPVQAIVDVAGHQVHFDREQRLWYCDISFNLEAYAPFVRLAVARYQPYALNDAKLSRAALADFVQLTPDRAAVVTADPYHPQRLRVTVSGVAPSGPIQTLITVDVQRRDSAIASDLGWTDVSAAIAQVKREPLAVQPDSALWSGTIEFASPPDVDSFRLLIREYEFIPADPGVTTGVEFRPPAGGSIPGRLIYAETILIDSALVSQPPDQAAEPGVGEPLPDTRGGRIIVKLRDDVEIPYEDEAERFLGPIIGPAWQALVAQFPFLTLNRLFTALDPSELANLIDNAREVGETEPPRLFSYFVVLLPLSVDPDEVAIALSTFPEIIEFATPELEPEVASVTPGNNLLYLQQGYLQAAPNGIDAVFAWGFTGGDGVGVRFADIEPGWTLDHEDLVGAKIRLVGSGINSPDPHYREHGLQVLSTVMAVDNNKGTVGIVPRTTAILAGAKNGENAWKVPDAIQAILKYHISDGPVRHAVSWRSNAACVEAFLRYPTDDGQSWQRIGGRSTAAPFQVDFDELPGSPRYRLALVVTADCRSATVVSPSFQVPEKSAHMVTVVSPAEGAVLQAGTPVLLESAVAQLLGSPDAERERTIDWHSDRDGELGTGPTLSTILTPGEHRLSASVSGESLSSTVVSVRVI
jgi:hypothetical protein